VTYFDIDVERRMAKRHKDFGSAPKQDDFEPLSFTYDGQEYECRPMINGTVLLKFVRDADSGEGGKSAGALLNLFGDVLLADDFKRFEEYVNDPDTIVEIEKLGEIAAWVVEEYTARPTQASSNSSNGRTRTGGRSKVGSSSAG
jgi:hypothetical protein